MSKETSIIDSEAMQISPELIHRQEGLEAALDLQAVRTAQVEAHSQGSVERGEQGELLEGLFVAMRERAQEELSGAPTAASPEVQALWEEKTRVA